MAETFGAALHRWRVRRRVSLRKLSTLVPYSHSHIWDVERGTRKATDTFARLLDIALDADGELIAIAAREKTLDASLDDSIAWTQDGANAVAQHLSSAPIENDGELVAGPALTGLAHEWLLADPEPLKAVANGGRIGETMVNALGTVVEEFRRRDDEEGGGELLHLIEPEVQFIARLISRGSYTGEVGKALHVRLAEMTQVAGWAAFDAGLHRCAQRYLEAALHASAAADNRMLGAYVLSSLGFQAADIGRPLDGVTILRSADAGVKNVATPLVHSVLGTWEARAAARAGERHMFERALSRASREYEKGARPDDPDWVYWMIQPELTAEAGRSFALTGDPDNAIGYLEQGLATLGVEYTRDRALYTSYLAEAHLLGGKLESACHWTEQARPLMRDLKSPRVVDHLEGVERRLAA